MSPSITQLCRENETTIREAIGRTGQSRIAESTGLSETKISRWKDGEAAQVASLLAAAGLKVVEKDSPYVDADRLKAITILAREALKETGWGSLE